MKFVVHIMVLVVIVLKRLLNIEVFYVISLKKMNVSENVLNSYTKKILLKNIMIL